MQALLKRWRDRADSYDTAASGYNRKCIAVKGVQLQLRAIELRKCADELEALNEAGKVDPQGIDAQAGTRAAAPDAGAMAEERPGTEADDRLRPAEAQRQDQAP